MGGYVRLEWIILPGCAATGVCLYNWMKSTTASQIEKAPLLEINNDLMQTVAQAPGQCIPYAVIKGKVETYRPQWIEGNDGPQWIQSRYAPPNEHGDACVGVVQVINSTQRPVEVNTVPFILTPHTSNNPFIEIREPLKASPLHLRTIYNDFHEVEKMLLKGENVIAVGELSIVGNSVVIGPPSDGKQYILATSSLEELVRDLKLRPEHSSKCMWKILTFIFGFITGTTAVVIMRKRYAAHIDMIKEQHAARIREVEEQHAARIRELELRARHSWSWGNIKSRLQDVLLVFDFGSKLRRLFMWFWI